MQDIEDIMRSCNSADRPQAFLAWAQQQTDDEVVWPAMADAWSGFDAISHSAFSDLFISYPWRPEELIEHLPCRITVYRGREAGIPDGLSWTTDINVAMQFASGHRGIRNAHPVVHVAQISRDDVAFTCDDRGDAELVLLNVPTDDDTMTIDAAAVAA